MIIEHMPPNFPDSFNWPEDQLDNVPACCLNCKEHPSNGGSESCECDKPFKEEERNFSFYEVKKDVFVIG